MKLGTKSLLFGAHCMLIHPWFVAWAWIKLYGWPSDWRLWLAFLLHDIGYWGKADMDGPEGSQHPVLGARVMHSLFDRSYKIEGYNYRSTLWRDFMLTHSRDFARRMGLTPSRLCIADKLATIVTPSWLWVFCATLSGELAYFMTSPHVRLADPSLTPKQWIDMAKEDSRSWFKINFGRHFSL